MQNAKCIGESCEISLKLLVLGRFYVGLSNYGDHLDHNFLSLSSSFEVRLNFTPTHSALVCLHPNPINLNTRHIVDWNQEARCSRNKSITITIRFFKKK